MANRRTVNTRRSTDASKRQRQVPGTVPPVEREKPVVLVVDDDPDCRTMYSMFLHAAGCEVFTANDGRAALEKAIDLLPHVIVMDLAMPRVDGWEAIRRLRDSSWTRKIPIIAISAAPMSRETAFEAGCDAYLSKPCDPQTVWSQIRSILKLPDTGPVYS